MLIFIIPALFFYYINKPDEKTVTNKRMFWFIIVLGLVVIPLLLELIYILANSFTYTYKWPVEQIGYYVLMVLGVILPVCLIFFLYAISVLIED